MTTVTDRRHPASFRDPAGFIFHHEGVLYRQVNDTGKADYDQLMDSGLYDQLVKRGLLVAHEEVDDPPASRGAYKVIRPARVPFVNYPYEWCFSQLKAAALATLDIQMAALEKGMTLKDSSAYNMQFWPGKKRPVLIDTLSLAVHEEGRPWEAYGQFVRHFLAPLTLMHYKDVRLSKLALPNLDGVPTDLASRLLPRRTRWRPGLAMHLHLLARFEARHADSHVDRGRRMSQNALKGLVDSLASTVRRLEWKPGGTEWGDYYDHTNYSDASFQQKKEEVTRWAKSLPGGMIFDLGANTGVFSREAAAGGATVVAFDIDPTAVEQNFRSLDPEAGNVLPLESDLTNPSPPIGWANQERQSLVERGPADGVMALALIHHLAISNNVPLQEIAQYFASLGDALLLEFVPKQDSQVEILLRTRKDIFPDYHEEGFETAFEEFFEIQQRIPIAASERTLYHLRRRQ